MKRRNACIVGRNFAVAVISLAGLWPTGVCGQNPFVPPPRSFSPLEPRPLSLAPEDPPLPPLDVLLPRVEVGAFPPLQIHVTVFRFQGNRVFSDEQLTQVVAPFAGRTITAEELEEARLALSAHYVKNGY